MTDVSPVPGTVVVVTVGTPGPPGEPGPSGGVSQETLDVEVEALAAADAALSTAVAARIRLPAIDGPDGWVLVRDSTVAEGTRWADVAVPVDDGDPLTTLAGDPLTTLAGDPLTTLAA